MPINYQEGKIYKIYNTINDDIYVGSTTLKLCERMTHHRRCLNSTSKKHRSLYKSMSGNGVYNFFIELIEKCPCNDKEELLKKEGEYIRALKPTLNKIIPGRTLKEFNEDNKEYIRERKQQYTEDHKEHISQVQKEWRENNKERQKQYREDNKEHRQQKQREWREDNKEYRHQYYQTNKYYCSEKITCECGCIVTRGCLPRHQRSKKHIDLIKDKLN